MKWSKPADLRAQVQKLWDKGELLSTLVSAEAFFPKRLQLKTPTSAEIAEQFDAVRSWSMELRAMPHCRITMREFRHRVFGENSMPQEAWLDNIDNALAIIGKSRDAARFAALLEATRQYQPPLLDWLSKRPLRALELADDWQLLLDIVAWVQQHPRPALYLRQIDIPGIHSKFIEAHRGVLIELLDAVLPSEAIDTAATGLSQFSQRYGFRDKPARIRFRILDPKYSLLPGDTPQDITLDAASFARLEPKISRIFITENEINFLAFPQLKDSMVIFGAGYGFDMLRHAAWFKRCNIHYWGDIDTHGLAILDQLRSQFEHVESFLMDRSTLLAFETQWGYEEKQVLRDLLKLTPEEKSLYDDLRDNRMRKNLRLEQEKVGFGWVELALDQIFH